MANSSLLKQNCPKGVMNVVSSLDSLAWGICQNPLFASSLLKSFASNSSTRVVSTLGIGWTSRKTFSLSGLKSTQIQTAPRYCSKRHIHFGHSSIFLKQKVPRGCRFIVDMSRFQGISTSGTMSHNRACVITTLF